MKKTLSILLALALVTALLVGCGSTTTTSTNTQTATTNTETTKTDDAKANLKVGFIFLHDENSTYDLNFLNAAKETCKAMGFSEDQFIYRTNIPEGQECYDTAAELVDAGCTIVFADSFGHEDFMIQAAKEFPNVQFCHATGTRAHTEGLSNYHNAFASIYEGRYLAGVAAGMKLNEMIEAGEFTAEEAKMGYVGAFTYAEVVSGYSSFFLGARSVCPTVTMEVTFTGSWYDETAEKEGANKLIANGCKLISQHADSMGAPTACETAGVPDVSYNGSTKDACPNTFIVSSRIDWAPYYQYVINAVLNGEEIPSDYTGTIGTGSVKLTEVNEQAAAAGTAEAIEAVKAELTAGTRHVYDVSTFTVGGEALSSYLADVDTDAAYTGDTEVVLDGYFHESEFRSAPYFDLQIDGITLLDTAF
ncbi:MAG: BMP family ABC transporter substrate-binding protein [Oscillospiraceae bacterium]|nr:BMP family ABC transporter substrate-binding protein [Oscillospiraceae bacterium]